jgi:hypothetical protein
LDWGPLHMTEHPTTTSRPEELALQCVEAVPWTVGRAYQHESGSHINLTEVREIVAELRERVEQNMMPDVGFYDVDSRVVVGSWAKGRSNSTR